GPPTRLWRWARRRPALALTSAAAFVALAAGVILAVTLAIVETQNAENLRNALGESQRQRRKADLLAANLALNQGLTLGEQGEIGKGLLWMARALQLTPQDEADLRRVIRMNLALYGRQAARLQAVGVAPGPIIGLALNADGRTALTCGNDAWLWD